MVPDTRTHDCIPYPLLPVLALKVYPKVALSWWCIAGSSSGSGSKCCALLPAGPNMDPRAPGLPVCFVSGLCQSETETALRIIRILRAQGLSCGCCSDPVCTVEVFDTCRSQEHSQQATACQHAAQQMLGSRPGGCCTPLPFQTALLFAEDQVDVNHAEHVSSLSMSIYNIFSKRVDSPKTTKDHVGKQSPNLWGRV